MCGGYTDMRRSIEMVLQLLFSRTFLLGHVREACFFLRKKRDRLKALLWEEDGFLLMYKCLDNGVCQWPHSESKEKTAYLWAVCIGLCRDYQSNNRKQSESLKSVKI